MGHLPDDPEDELLLHVIPYEYASEIASVVSGWAMLEYEIDGAIWNLAGLEYNPKVGACLTAQYSTVNSRFNALIALARVRGVSEFEIAKINKFKERTLAIGERRNRVVHDPWLTGYDFQKSSFSDQQGKTYRLQKTARSKLEYEYKPIALEELKTLNKDIQTAIEEFNNLSLITTIELNY